MNPQLVLRPGLATACGSLPHADPADAAALLLDTVPDLPAVPSLPNRHPAEGMIGQAVTGLAGVEVGPDGSVAVPDPDAVPDDAAGIDSTLPADAFGATLAFLDLLAERRWVGPLKLQCTGPVTLGQVLVDAGVAPRTAFPAAAAAVRRRARALVEATRTRLPDAGLVFVLDEPWLGQASLGAGAVPAEDAVDLVSSALAAVEAHAVTGLHCCAPADWGTVLRSGPDLLSLPVDVASTLRASDLGPFLERGGWVAWGAVPTDGPLGPVDGGGTVRLWRHLAARWHTLADGGVDPVLLRRRAIVTPACGLARHDVAQATLALHLTASVAARVAAGTHPEERWARG